MHPSDAYMPRLSSFSSRFHFLVLIALVATLPLLTSAAPASTITGTASDAGATVTGTYTVPSPPPIPDHPTSPPPIPDRPTSPPPIPSHSSIPPPIPSHPTSPPPIPSGPVSMAMPGMALPANAAPPPPPPAPPAQKVVPALPPANMTFLWRADVMIGQITKPINLASGGSLNLEIITSGNITGPALNGTITPYTSFNLPLAGTGGTDFPQQLISGNSTDGEGFLMQATGKGPQGSEYGYLKIVISGKYAYLQNLFILQDLVLVNDQGLAALDAWCVACNETIVAMLVGQ